MADRGAAVLSIIERTKRRQPLAAKELEQLVDGYLRDAIPDYQVAAWLMAVCLQGLGDEETAALTQALVAGGRRLDLRAHGIEAVDKHSTGGIGDKTTLVLGPLAAAVGLTVAKMSGRGLGFTGGTLDKLESIPGLRVDLSVEAFIRQARMVGLVVAGQTADLAPGDGKLYALRDVTGTVDSIPLIAASIMSKKIAAGAATVILDIKTGDGAFMERPEAARRLATTMLAIGRAAGLHVAGVISSMEQPLGMAIGNALEVAEAVRVLQGAGPEDVRELCLRLGAELLLLASAEQDATAARARLEAALASGAALEKLRAMVAAQGGNPRSLDVPGLLPAAPEQAAVLAPRAGYVGRIAARDLGHAAIRLGAGRSRKGDGIDHATGFVLHAKLGDHVRAGEPLATVHAGTSAAATAAAADVLAVYTLADAAPALPPLITEVLR